LHGITFPFAGALQASQRDKSCASRSGSLRETQKRYCISDVLARHNGFAKGKCQQKLTKWLIFNKVTQSALIFDAREFMEMWCFSAGLVVFSHCRMLHRQCVLGKYRVA
jgi:hypothetical protein